MTEFNDRFYLFMTSIPNYFECLKSIVPSPSDYSLEESLKQKALAVFAINK